MKLRYKIGIGFLAVIALGLTALAIAMSYESECPPPATTPAGANTMKAIRYHCYGSPVVLRLENVEKPTIADDQILVKVHAASANPLDWHYVRGEPYIMRLFVGFGAPKDPRLGVDFAGTVEAVGPRVTRFNPGDEVFGGAGGAFAEYIKVSERRGVALKPDNISFEHAAAVGVAGITALQGLRDHGRLQPGHKVLINGASGGVGTFAVQIAKSMGAEVTGVCSGRNVDMVRSLGADHVIDYSKENFTELNQRYDVILDNVGNHSLGDLRRALEPEGTLVIVGTSSTGDFVGPLWRPLIARMMDPFVSQNFENFIAQFSYEDLNLLAGLMRNNEMRPVIDRIYPLSEVPDAIRYSESGHARAKIVIEVR